MAGGMGASATKPAAPAATTKPMPAAMATTTMPPPSAKDNTTTTATTGEAFVCPTLPPDVPAPDARFVLSAAKLAGSKTQTLAYNRSLVGPLIRVKRGDVVQIDAANADITPGTSVHWHGQDLPEAAWSDGVAGVSQDPTPPGAVFSYRFKAEPAGTFWYHSHTGEQYGDGLRGPLIVDDADNDPHRSLYDEDRDEHVLMLADVFDTTVEEQLKALQTGGMGMVAQEAGAPAAESMPGEPAQPAGPMGKMLVRCPRDVLNQDISDAPWFGVQVNGRGWIGGGGRDNNADPKMRTGVPLVVTVSKGKRYRLRVIGGMSSWALRFGPASGPHKNLTVIALDGRPIKPIEAPSVVLTSGERADVILNADAPVGNYWVDVSTLDGRNSPVILHYQGAPDPLRDPRFLASATRDAGCAVGGRGDFLDPKNASIVAAATGVPAPPQGDADKQFTIYLVDASSSIPPPSFLRHIKQGGNVHGLPPNFTIPAKGPACPDSALYCWSNNWNAYQPTAKAPALLPAAVPQARTYNIDVDQGDVVDLLLVNPSLMVHPMHLHGSGFWVLAAGNGRATDGSDKLSPKLKLNLDNPPQRDTMPVAQAVGLAEGNGTTENDADGYGFAVLRFKADNPGVWSFHCHIDLHAASGMFMTITVRPKNNGTWFLPQNLECTAAGAKEPFNSSADGAAMTMMPAPRSATSSAAVMMSTLLPLIASALAAVGLL